MGQEQDWRTESYKGMEVHVTALRCDAAGTSWDFSVRVTQPGEDAASESELVAESGDDATYSSEDAAVEAGFAKGYALVERLLG